MGEVPSSKKELRNFFLNIRKELSQRTVEENSARILSHLADLKEFKDARIVHTYVSIKKSNEVDTFPLIKRCFERRKKVVVPKIAGDGILYHLELTSVDDLHVNSWGIPEPVGNNVFSTTGLDIVIVPMVAGDFFKNRLGYGKGYYDRFLKDCPATKIGLLFDCQLYQKKLPVESFDIPLDILITESRRID